MYLFSVVKINPCRTSSSHCNSLHVLLHIGVRRSVLSAVTACSVLKGVSARMELNVIMLMELVFASQDLLVIVAKTECVQMGCMD